MPIRTLNNQLFNSNGNLVFFTLDELKDSEVGVKFIDFLFEY